MERFADRLDPATFASDEPVEFRTSSQAVGTGTFLPEGVLARVRSLGVAYDLHVLENLITPYEAVELEWPQAESLLAEIEFLAEVVNDPVVSDAVTSISLVVAAAARGRETLVVDWDI